MRLQPAPLLYFVLLYPAWLLLQALHEFGHILHAWVSGASGICVELPLVGFSRTGVATNPHPLFVVWGGVIWGIILPLVLWLVIPRRSPGLRRVFKAFAGLCLIANGAYLAVGWIDRVGDAGDLLRHGVPPWLLITIGVPAIASGLWLWHRLGTSAANKKRADVE